MNKGGNQAHPRSPEDQKAHEAVLNEYLAYDKKHLPAPLFAFVEVHEWDSAKDRTQAVYSCRTEETFLIEEGKPLEFIRYAISWAEYVQDFGDYETVEEFFHGTPEEWAFEVKKSNEWISLLKEWRASL